MQVIQEQIVLSASDLMRFMGCPHATALDLAYLQGRGPTPRETSEDAELLQKQGNEHEARYLDCLRSEGLTILEIERGWLPVDAEATRKALKEGPDVIYQGAFLSGNWGGWSDFLIRVDKPSRLGNFSYEVVDTKLKRKPHPKHILQLVLYSDLLMEIQGAAPEAAHIELGNGTRYSARLSDYAYYARATRPRLESFIARTEHTRPTPCADCALCRWGDHCEETWQAEDSLFTTANITRGQVKKLERAGIRTLAELASLTKPIRGISEPTRIRLAKQASLQHARKDGPPMWTYRDPEPGKGFDLLPEPQSGDLFYDIEGDPFFEGGLEYLHGIWFDGQFRAFWAHSHAAEAQALSNLLDFFRERLALYPNARIYHYAPYELVALRRLTAKYGIGEAYLDRLMRERRFIDLYAVVRGAIIASEKNYSIKSMEAFYGLVRDGEVKTAGGSVVAYEQWLETGDQKILDEIEDYNRIDCISTQKLRDWLVGIRPDGPWPIPGLSAEDQENEEDAATRDFRSKLAGSKLTAEQQEALFNLGLFHQREAKPANWAVFDSVGKDDDDLIDDLDALGGLEATGPAEEIARSLARTYQYPHQETKLRTGKSATIPNPDGNPVTAMILSLDNVKREVIVKLGKNKAHLLRDRLSLHPDWPLNTNNIAAALRDGIADRCGAQRYKALGDLLNRSAPRLKGGPRSDILNGLDAVTGTIAAVHAMQETVLPIQGPPGTGKTYVTARAILSLVKAGHRVGVSSNSHEAIRNVLLGCLEAQKEDISPPHLNIYHKVSSGDDGYPDDCPVHRETDNETAAANGNIVGGTAFFFSREDNIGGYDWLFVDEAGQVSLANMFAMGRATRNMVLVGDPCQLPQVIQGTHPPPANLSCLEWMLGEHATIPPDRGIFLPISRRMHPEVCRFISDQIYEGRLTSHPDTAMQLVNATDYPEAGAFWIPISHEGNSQSSAEEVRVIREGIDTLLKGNWTGKDGVTRPISESDIIVVAPYNAQVNALREALPEAIRVGTVDKFQGQEAPVCIVSMTTSSVEEMPRGLEFLFSLNRINVAVSRAKGLALVFGCPRLREAKCETVEQVRLVNTLCALPVFTT